MLRISLNGLQGWVLWEMMTTYLVSRHAGAFAWFEREGVRADEVCLHLDIEVVKIGDVVAGTLPVSLAEEVCSKGARYLHLSLQVPREFRGSELTAEQMGEFGAELQEYVIRRVVT